MSDDPVKDILYRYLEDLDFLPNDEAYDDLGGMNTQYWINHRRGRSIQEEWADLAKELSIDFNEYSAFLGAFDIKVRVEKDNISYLYPDKKRPVRGEKLGDNYERKSLTNYLLKMRICIEINQNLELLFLGKLIKLKIIGTIF